MSVAPDPVVPVGDAAARDWRPLRIWIPIVLLLGMPVSAAIPRWIDDIPQEVLFLAAAGPALLGILVLGWWLTFSRAGWKESILGLLGWLSALAVAVMGLHPTLVNPAGIAMLTIPLGTAAFALALVLLFRRRPRVRTSVAVIAAAIGFGYTTLLRNDGMLGNYALQLDYRWNPTPEEALLAAQRDLDETLLSAAAIQQWVADPEWAAFRGPQRDSVYRGPAIATNWSTQAPELIWKIPVGPAWSSFAVAGDLLFTQEQRGQQEVIVAYSAINGDQVWVQGVETRFEEPLGGPGPRATPTLAEGSLYALGANGHLLKLDPVDGDILWQVDLRALAGYGPPIWGFASSPLVHDGKVIVHAGSEDDAGVVLALDTDSGQQVWSSPTGGHSYSSAQLAEVAGQPTVLMLSHAGLAMLDPASGEVRLEYPWQHEGYRSLQPQVSGGDSVVLPTGLGTGTRRIRVQVGESGWEADEIWTSRHLKPDFNDFVIHGNYIYGFDRTTFTCVELETGDRVWKRGRYGAGQVLLLEQSDALLVLSEQGQVVLLKADPSAHQEWGQFQALEGKTWNHPVLIDNRLYVRNGQQAACYQLPLADEAITKRSAPRALARLSAAR